MSSAPSVRPGSSTYGLSDSPSSSSSLFLSLSGAASPFSSNISCGNYSTPSSSNLSESPGSNNQQQLQHKQQQQQQQPQQQLSVDDWPTLPFLQQQQQQQQDQQLPQDSSGADSSIWNSLDLTRSDDSDQQPVAFEAFDGGSLCNFTVWPQMLAECQGDSLHNRIFERGENYFGFSQADRQLLELAIRQDHDRLLLTHFPRRKLDADLRVPATVYLDDKSGRRQLTLDVTCGQPVSKLLVRSHAIGLAPGERLQPCQKCAERHGSQQLVSVQSHSLEALVHSDWERQASCLYVTGQPETGRIWLTLRYNCSQDHLRNSLRLGHLALANLLTIVEAYDQLGRLLGRASYRVRVVASPARDLLRFLTNQLTPEQTGCTLGQCAHLAARWKPDKFKHLPVDDLRQCLSRYRFKEELRCELQLLAELPSKRQQQQQQQLDELKSDEQAVGLGEMRTLPDGSLLVRVADRAKMARIRSAVAAVLADDDEAASQLPQPQQQLQQHQMVSLLQHQQQTTAVAATAAATFQPILLIRPYCHFSG